MIVAGLGGVRGHWTGSQSRLAAGGWVGSQIMLHPVACGCGRGGRNRGFRGAAGVRKLLHKEFSAILFGGTGEGSADGQALMAHC